MKKVFSLLLGAVLLCPLLAGCGIDADAANDGLSIVTTTFPPYDFARAVTGDTSAVTMLIDPGTETHSYDPSPKDIRLIQNADVFIYGGGESDAWMDGILSSIDTATVTVLSMTDIVPLLVQEDDHDHDHGEPIYDEHVWTSPANAVLLTEAIRDAVIAVDPDNAAVYETNATAYIGEIHALAADFTKVIESGARRQIVFADRYPFLYFSEAFGLSHFSAFAGCAHETEPGARTIAAMIELVKTEKIPAVFYIEFSDRRLADTVAEATGCETLLFHSCHNVTKAEWDAGVTYVSLMRQNLDNLRKALS